MFLLWRYITDMKINFNHYEESFFAHKEIIIDASQYNKKFFFKPNLKSKELMKKKELQATVVFKNFKQDLKQTI